MSWSAKSLCWSLLLGIVSTLLVGCNYGEGNKLSAPTETESKKEWLIVSSDHAKLEAARDKAKKLKSLALADFYKRLNKTTYLDAESLEMIASQRDDFVNRLNRLADSSMARNQGIGAALVLLRLKEPSGFARVKEVLRSGKDEQKVRVLSSLGWMFALPQTEEFQSYRQFIQSDSEFVNLVMKLLDGSKSDVVNAAAQLGGTLKFPGLSDRILEVLQKPNDLDRDRLVYWLSQSELTEQIFEFAMSPSERARIATDENWSGSLYRAFARSQNEDWSRPAREILILKLTASPEKTKGNYSGWRIGLVSAVAETATKDDLLRIRSLAKREHGYYATTLLTGWIRLDPKGGRKTLLQWLEKSDRRDAAIDAAARVYAKTGDAVVVEAIKRISGEVPDRELYSVCHALQAIGGDAGRELLTALVPRLEKGQRAYFQRTTAVVPIDELLTAIENSGVFPADKMSQVAAKFRRDSQKAADTDSAETSALSPANHLGEDLEGHTPPELLDAFVAAKCVISFDTETGTLPCRHDQLLQDFANASRGRFVPEAASEEWLKKKKSDDEAPYRVQFIHQGRLYDGELRNLGDWYDVERLTAMINRALQDAEMPERFVSLASEGQEATFIFAEPSRLTPLAKKFHMPLSDDVGEATKRGLEFEQSVKEQLDQAVKQQLTDD